VAVRAEVRRLSTFPYIHYADAFLVEPGLADDQTLEEWVHDLFHRSPLAMQALLPVGWSSLGLKVGSPRADELMFGWQVRRSTPELLILGVESRAGMPAELLFKRHGQALLFATLIQHQSLLAKILWPGVAPGHRQVVRRMLQGAAARNARRVEEAPALKS
jgi:hypothetical protein